jgi:hypothetical protein
LDKNAWKRLSESPYEKVVTTFLDRFPEIETALDLSKILSPASLLEIHDDELAELLGGPPQVPNGGSFRAYHMNAGGRPGIVETDFYLGALANVRVQVIFPGLLGNMAANNYVKKQLHPLLKSLFGEAIGWAKLDQRYYCLDYKGLIVTFGQIPGTPSVLTCITDRRLTTEEELKQVTL